MQYYDYFCYFHLTPLKLIHYLKSYKLITDIYKYINILDIMKFYIYFMLQLNNFEHASLKKVKQCYLTISNTWWVCR